MFDVLSPTQRKYCMSRIQGNNTKPEVLLRKALWNKGLRYRLNYKITGKPDLVFPSKKVAVFVDGCFWHRCPDHYVSPKTRAQFWEAKIQGNVERDKKNNASLENAGWKVVRIWEHEINEDLDLCVTKIGELLKQKNLIG